ncbi:MAG: endonuclease III [Acidimicrobiia bacterium]|nr:endonuclease III [Acidimicrobiia bacterium]
MPYKPEPSDEQVKRARSILRRLKLRYPQIRTALDYRNPFELLTATIVSAQTTDENVNRALPELFSRYPTAHDLAIANPEDVEQLIYSTGFYRQKTKSILSMATDLVERFGGVVPDTLDELVQLRGVGRKTASVVLAEVFGKPAIAVDTHVKRLARRWDLTESTDPERIELDLMAVYPRRQWAGVSMRFIQYGRDVCTAKRPSCYACKLIDLCPYEDKTPAPA